MFQILVLWKNGVSFPQQLRDALVWVSYGHFYKQMLYFFIFNETFPLTESLTNYGPSKGGKNPEQTKLKASRTACKKNLRCPIKCNLLNFCDIASTLIVLNKYSQAGMTKEGLLKKEDTKRGGSK
jgi:hypothetical protein